jgi:hypothetical protein
MKIKLDHWNGFKQVEIELAVTRFSKASGLVEELDVFLTVAEEKRVQRFRGFLKPV